MAEERWSATASKDRIEVCGKLDWKPFGLQSVFFVGGSLIGQHLAPLVWRTLVITNSDLLGPRYLLEATSDELKIAEALKGANYWY